MSRWGPHMVCESKEGLMQRKREKGKKKGTFGNKPCLLRAGRKENGDTKRGADRRPLKPNLKVGRLGDKHSEFRTENTDPI